MEVELETATRCGADGTHARRIVRDDSSANRSIKHRGNKSYREAGGSHEDLHIQEGRHRQAIDAGGRHPHGEFGSLAAIRLREARATEWFEARDALAASRRGCALLRGKRRGGSSSKRRRQLRAEGSKGGDGKQTSERQKVAECYNCGKKGHYRRDRWHPQSGGRGKDDKGHRGNEGSEGKGGNKGKGKNAHALVDPWQREVETSLHGHFVELGKERNVYKLNVKSNTKNMRELWPAVMVGGSSSSGGQWQASP